MSITVPPKPSLRPVSPNFSSGPCTKRPGWSVDVLKNALVGRSHRSKPGKDKLKKVIDETKALLELPADYLVGIMAASDTGAVEAALWSLLGPRPVDVFAWESFGKDWVTDCVKQLKPLEARGFVADFGQLPDLAQANFDRDVVFTWNGTTAGVVVPNGDWIPDNRKGLTICDATSSAFGIPMPWHKLDVVTYSWQKVLGGEAQHGILILSPRAVERLESHTPPWPMPKIFRMTHDGKLNKNIFDGETINTPSMLCVEDALDGLNWVRSIGGAKGMVARTQANFKILAAWVERAGWVDFLCADAAIRSPTSVCLKLADPGLVKLSREEQANFCKKLTGLLEKEGAAFDINAYRDAPPGLRIWCGATVEAKDIEILTTWLDWGYATCRAEMKIAA
ncbi:MAG: phosphoserine transaminase [Alphaproteobacteria bacterium]|nr:phosphoserine transaminase [Alphaproteobacteria bacterium]